MEGVGFDSLRVLPGVQTALHLEPGLGSGGRDQIDDHLVTDERFAAPVLGNEREQPVFDLVPLAAVSAAVATR